MTKNNEDLESLAIKFLTLDANGTYIPKSDWDLASAALILSHVMGCKVFARVVAGEISEQMALDVVGKAGEHFRQLILEATGVDLKEAMK